MPYDGDSVMIMPWAYNSAKSCCSVFKTTKSLRRASRSAGMNMRDFTRTTFAKWTVKFLRAFPIECTSFPSNVLDLEAKFAPDEISF